MRIYLYAAIALAIIGAGLYVSHLKGKADERDAAVAALSEYRVAVTAREKKAADDQAKAEARSITLAKTEDTVTAKLNVLRASPPKQVIRYVEIPVASGGNCADIPSLRLGPEWVQQYNAASDASAVPDPG